VERGEGRSCWDREGEEKEMTKNGGENLLNMYYSIV
jgi:hypothetical protein